jgi:predicted MPP superfamily phosphohydrolase
MKLGLLADIHEHVEHLKSALENFQRAGVDQVVVIGDVFDRGPGLAETCQLLKDAGAVGVWGNHDYGLCAAQDEVMHRNYGPQVLEYLATFQPKLNLAGCYFSHVEPWLDPHRIEDLWYFEGLPETQDKLDRIFQAGSQRLMFAGHYHCWLLATPDGLNDWQGQAPISLAEGRYFIVIGALCHGRSAIFDTETSLLLPFNAS